MTAVAFSHWIYTFRRLRESLLSTPTRPNLLREVFKTLWDILPGSRLPEIFHATNYLFVLVPKTAIHLLHIEPYWATLVWNTAEVLLVFVPRVRFGPRVYTYIQTISVLVTPRQLALPGVHRGTSAFSRHDLSPWNPIKVQMQNFLHLLYRNPEGVRIHNSNCQQARRYIMRSRSSDNLTCFWGREQQTGSFRNVPRARFLEIS